MESTKQIIETINSNKFTFIFIVLLLSTVLFSLISRLAYNLKTCEIIKQEADIKLGTYALPLKACEGLKNLVRLSL